MTQFKLFTNVNEYYTDLQTALRAAQHHIHMAYYAFGFCCKKIMESGNLRRF